MKNFINVLPFRTTTSVLQFEAHKMVKGLTISLADDEHVDTMVV